MDCSEAKPHLSAFASGLTNDLDREEIEAHISMCDECSVEVELLRARASGNAVPPPAGDWTVEKIFADGGGAEAPGPAADAGATAEDDPSTRDLPPTPSAYAEPPLAAAPGSAPDDLAAAAEPSAAPAPLQAVPPQATPRPSMILPPPEPDPEPAPPVKPPKTAKKKSESWGFEPADAGRETAPPEESVVLAEKALNRAGGKGSAKNSALRALGWAFGGVAGVALLGVSVWIALEMQQSAPTPIATGAARSRSAEAESGDPAPAPADSSAAVAPDASAIQAGVLSPPGSEAADAAHGAPPAAASLPSASDPAPAAPVPTAAAPAPAAPKGAAAGRAATAKKGTSAALAPAPRAASAPSTARATDPPRTGSAAPKHDDDDMWPTDDPVRPSAAPPATTAKRAAPAVRETTAKHEAAVVRAPAAVRDSAPAADTSASAAAEPQGEAKPIDRLHAATLKAEQDHDLNALRQLKTAWKSMVKTAVVGRDRSRAKREYADCLWAIQAITAREADQREALSAYRDYLLNAPAGGADPRSAERLRELEDASRERR